MNKDHWAIVIGISRYPGFGMTAAEPNHLEGPVNDAIAVREWLITSGGVPKENVFWDTSDNYPPTDDPLSAKPKPDELTTLVRRLEREVVDNNKPAKRLYVYVAGHGFSPRPDRAGLYSADATVSYRGHFPTTNIIEIFFEQEIFDEHILWYDCCMALERSFELTPPPFKYGVSGGSGRRSFAFAAEYTKNAVEAKMEDGIVHGVFTHTLLKGLNGGAADESGEVKTKNLQTFLSANMRRFMTEAQVNDASVSKSPSFSPNDDFALVDTPLKKWLVTFAIPELLKGKTAVVISFERGVLLGTASYDIEAEFTLGDVDQVELPTGFFTLMVVETGREIPFEVWAEDEIAIDVSALAS